MTSAALRLHHVRAEVAAAAHLAGRDAASVSLIAVSKTRSEAAIEELIAAGQESFGESRVQEAQGKWPHLRACYPKVRLHCIGRLQSNKAEDAVDLFDVVHSVDRASLLDALVKAAAKAQRFPAIYVQVNIGDEKQKGGCTIADLGDLVAAARASPLPLLGVMAIPPFGVEPSPYYALLAKLAWRHDVSGLSMGMSSDFPAAVRLGATAVRIGSALFDQ